MRLRHNPEALPAVTASPLVYGEAAALSQRGQWRQCFAAPGQPLFLEIGMGRGLFLSQAAQLHPELNYLGLELREEMVMVALSRLEEAAAAGMAWPGNLRFLWFNAERLADAFAPGEVSGIYLNFSDPWPKSRHAKRRLSAPAFLALYRTILAPDGQVFFKTDNQEFFTWSEASFRREGWQVRSVSRDLPAEKSALMTEYELRYRRQGKPICYLQATP